jgi:site-specific DNA recombinase
MPAQSDGMQDRVGLYFRMSRDVQDKSIARQASEVRPHCERLGYRVVAELKDEGISGSEVDRRPGLQKLLEMARTRQIDGVVVDDLDRLARLDLLELGELLSPLRRAGVWVESVAKGRVDFNSMGGRLQLGITGEAKREEQLATARRTLTSHIERARSRLRPPLAKTTYGYRRDPIPGTNLKAPPVIDEQTAEVVRSIFRWYAEGCSLGWIVAELYRRGVPSPGGRPRWLRSAVRDILKRPVYVGRRAWGRTTQGRFFRQSGGKIAPGPGNRKFGYNPPEEWFTTDDTPALIDPDLWDAAHRRLAAAAADPNAPRQRDGRMRGRERCTPTTEPGAFLLSGLLVCGRCGGPMVGFHKPKRCRPGLAYVCQNYQNYGTAVCIRAEAKEDWAVRQVIAELRDRLLLPERLEWLAGQLAEKARVQRRDGTLDRMRKEQATLEGKLSRYRLRLVEVSKDMVPEVEAQIRATRQALEAAQKAVRDAETADPVRELKITAEAAQKALWLLESALEGDNRCLLKEALRGVLAGVTIGADPYLTATGRTRHRARLDGISLRPGSGLDTLSLLSASSSASTP